MALEEGMAAKGAILQMGMVIIGLVAEPMVRWWNPIRWVLRAVPDLVEAAVRAAAQFV